MRRAARRRGNRTAERGARRGRLGQTQGRRQSPRLVRELKQRGLEVLGEAGALLERRATGTTSCSTTGRFVLALVERVVAARKECGEQVCDAEGAGIGEIRHGSRDVRGCLAAAPSPAPAAHVSRRARLPTRTPMTVTR